MIIYLLKGFPDYYATSLADAQSLFAALQDQTSSANLATIAQIEAKQSFIVQSDTGEPLTLSSIDDAAGTISSWVTDNATTLTVGLGDPDPLNTRLYCSTESFTISGSTRTGTLARNTTGLRDALAGSYGRPGRVNGAAFTLQLRKTTSGVTETVGLFPLEVRPGVLTATATDLDPETYLTTAAAFAAFAPRALSRNASNNASGTTTIAWSNTQPLHIEQVTFTGSAGTRTLVLDNTTYARNAGDLVGVHCAFPATANIVVDFRNATAAGTQLLEHTTDGTGPNLFALFTYTGTAYQRLLSLGV